MTPPFDALTPGERAFSWYLERVPLSLALWRSLEYQALAGLEFQEPILDLGCGDGLFAGLVFAERRVTGVDIDPAELRRARRSMERLRPVAADARRLPFRDACFATVFSNCVIEHVPQLEALLAEVRRVLAPGGRFVFTVPGEGLSANLPAVRLFTRWRLRFAARAYAALVHRLLRHVHVLAGDAWATRLDAAGLGVALRRPLVSAAAVRVFDLGNYTALAGYAGHRLTGRWVLLPGPRRRIVAPLFFARFRHLLGDGRDLGGGLLFVAVKGEADSISPPLADPPPRSTR